MKTPSENPDMGKHTFPAKATFNMKYNVVALDTRKPTLLVTPNNGVPGRGVMVELDDQAAIMMAANLLSSVQLNRKEE